MTETFCDICGDPTEPAAFVCRRCTSEAEGYLRRAAALAPEVETNVARLARYAVRGGRRAPLPEGWRSGAPVNRRQPVMAFGFAASRERLLANALRAEPLPVDLNASVRAAGAFNVIGTWARLVEEERGQRVPDIRVGDHPASVAARFLVEHLDWIRHQRFADEANDQLRAAGAVIERIVDRPPDEEVVGVCDCGEYLYSRRGSLVVSCTCGLSWDVVDSRLRLMEAMRERRVTVAEAATLGVMAFPDLQRERVRKLVQSWVRPDRSNHLIGLPGVDGPLYPFGEILDRLSRSVVRFASDDRASVTA